MYLKHFFITLPLAQRDSIFYLLTCLVWYSGFFFPEFTSRIISVRCILCSLNISKYLTPVRKVFSHFNYIANLGHRSHIIWERYSLTKLCGAYVNNHFAFVHFIGSDALFNLVKRRGVATLTVIERVRSGHTSIFTSKCNRHQRTLLVGNARINIWCGCVKCHAQSERSSGARAPDSMRRVQAAFNENQRMAIRDIGRDPAIP